jgi:hypothetical protein
VTSSPLPFYLNRPPALGPIALPHPVPARTESACSDAGSVPVDLQTAHLPNGCRVLPGTGRAWPNRPSVKTRRRLVVHGGFVVDDGRMRRLEQHARRLGFDDLRSLLQHRCDTGHSVLRLARELGVSEWTVTQALATLGVALLPRPQLLASHLCTLRAQGNVRERARVPIVRDWPGPLLRTPCGFFWALL